MRTLISIFFCCSFTGCATFSSGGVEIENVNRPLLELQKLVTKSLPLGLRKTSPNGREFFSNYFIAKDRKFKPAEDLPVRSYAQIFVLGAERPYTIRILVQNELAVSAGEYKVESRDDKLANIIRKRLDEQLNKRREDGNIIDDFRVF